MTLKRLFLILFCFVVFSSCSDDEDDPQPSNSDLLGNWKLSVFHYEGESEISVQGFTTKTTFEGNGYDMDYDLVFTADPNKVESSGSYSINLKYVVSSNLLDEDMEYEQNAEGIKYQSGSSWELKGDILTVTSDSGVSQDAEIISLSDTKLELKTTQTQNINGSQVEIDAFMTFEK